MGQASGQTHSPRSAVKAIFLGDRWTAARSWVALVAVAITTTTVIEGLLDRILSGSIVSSYSLSHYWVNYSDGFVRRGLPGEILVLLGATPTVPEMVVFAAGVQLACVTGLVMLVRGVARAVDAPQDRFFLAAFVCVSPFMFSRIGGLGGSDSFGPIAAAIIILLSRGLPGDARSRIGRGVTLCAVVALATAWEELLFCFTAPLAVLALYLLGWTARRLVWVAAAVLLPGAVLAVMSVFLRPSSTALVAAIGRARTAGLNVDLTRENSISALGQTAGNGFGNFIGTSLLTIVVFWVLCIGAFVISVPVVLRMTGQQHNRLGWLMVGVFSLASLVISLVANDYRRWWGAAFVATLAMVVMVTHGKKPHPLPLPGRTHNLLACALTVAALALQQVPGWPARWDPSADTGFSIQRLHVLNPDWHQ